MKRPFLHSRKLKRHWSGLQGLFLNALTFKIQYHLKEKLSMTFSFISQITILFLKNLSVKLLPFIPTMKNTKQPF